MEHNTTTTPEAARHTDPTGVGGTGGLPKINITEMDESTMSLHKTMQVGRCYRHKHISSPRPPREGGPKLKGPDEELNNHVNKTNSRYAAIDNDAMAATLPDSGSGGRVCRPDAGNYDDTNTTGGEGDEGERKDDKLDILNATTPTKTTPTRVRDI